MPDIHHDLYIAAPRAAVFAAMTSPAGLDSWWTLASSGDPRAGADYEFDFGPGYRWRATVANCEAGRALSWDFVDADDDWTGTRVAFRLEDAADGAGGTMLRFAHTGWRVAHDHFRRSSFCWALYLRLLRRYLEHGEVVGYARRGEA
jgi:uncharacterized protein YndB with AHSA1/START domain